MVSIADILFPKRCVSCGRWDSYLCNACLGQVSFLDEQFCPACKQTSILGYKNHGCGQRSELDQLYSVGWYRGPMRSLVNKFKFNSLISKLTETIEMLVKRVVDEEELNLWEDFTVTAVPLHPLHHRERGFNQSELIAKILADYSGLECNFELIQRKVASERQSSLQREARTKNVKGVFSSYSGLNMKSIPESVIIVDDVYTTGSTLRECARVLKNELSVKSVCGFTLARG